MSPRKPSPPDTSLNLNEAISVPTMITCAGCGHRFYATRGTRCIRCRIQNQEHAHDETKRPRPQPPPITIRTYS